MKVRVGVEKECLVYDQDMNPVDIDIDRLPEELTVDFANHQLEVVTETVNSALAANSYINKLLSNEYFEGKNIWPLSIPMDKNLNVLHNKLDKAYRDGLAAKYGIEKMLYSGIHFNYSNDKLESKEEYFQLIQNVFDFMPIIMQFTSYTPFAHHDLGGLLKIGNNYGFTDSLSLRASEAYGYSNEGDVELDFQTYDRYLQSKEYALTTGGLVDEREIYSKLRLKEAGNSNYIELRFLDLNPYIPAGISEETLVFVESCLNYLSDVTNDNFDYKTSQKQIENIALHGRDRNISLVINGKTDSLYNHTLGLIDKLLEVATINTYEQSLKILRLKYINNQLDIDVMCRTIETGDLSMQQFGLDNLHQKSKFNVLYPNLDMELSTKLVMNEAERRGYELSVESESQNIIKVTNASHSEYIIQATKTNLDGYASVLLMNDKYMTKKILSEHGIEVPTGVKLTKGDDLNLTFNHEVVVKPLDTNFGLGITICDGRDRDAVVAGCLSAFEYSEKILIEKFASGEEFRLLVIDGNVESVVTRKNANIIGNGETTIRQLIEEKNKSSLRSVGYKTPLEKIAIDDDLIRVIESQGYTLESIVDLSVKVLLRDTSNVSQGGDSHEVFDVMPEKYKSEAVKAAAALGVKICGIDMIIDFEHGHYTIIEANYNPAIHMHMFPYKGRGRDVASKVLDVLFKENN